MAEPTSCCAEPGGYCARVDTLFNLAGVHVLDIAWATPTKRAPVGLRLVVETAPAGGRLPGLQGDPRGPWAAAATAA